MVRQRGAEAAAHYVAIFPNSRITDVSGYGDGAPRPAGTVLTVVFELDGQPHLALSGGPEFRFTEAISPGSPITSPSPSERSCQDRP